MTKKDIIDGLKFTIDMFLFNPSDGSVLREPRNAQDAITVKACREAIKVLEGDVIARTKSHWVRIDDYHFFEDTLAEFKCPECGKQITVDAHPLRYIIELPHFCDNCGADMRL